jgi:hypothetical protein
VVVGTDCRDVQKDSTTKQYDSNVDTTRLNCIQTTIKTWLEVLVVKPVETLDLDLASYSDVGAMYESAYKKKDQYYQVGF